MNNQDRDRFNLVIGLDRGPGLAHRWVPPLPLSRGAHGRRGGFLPGGPQPWPILAPHRHWGMELSAKSTTGWRLGGPGRAGTAGGRLKVFTPGGPRFPFPFLPSPRFSMGPLSAIGPSPSTWILGPTRGLLQGTKGGAFGSGAGPGCYREGHDREEPNLFSPLIGKLATDGQPTTRTFLPGPAQLGGRGRVMTRYPRGKSKRSAPRPAGWWPTLGRVPDRSQLWATTC